MRFAFIIFIFAVSVYAGSNDNEKVTFASGNGVEVDDSETNRGFRAVQAEEGEFD